MSKPLMSIATKDIASVERVHVEMESKENSRNIIKNYQF